MAAPMAVASELPTMKSCMESPLSAAAGGKRRAVALCRFGRLGSLSGWLMRPLLWLTKGCAAKRLC